jgi:hypothetical protein
MELQNYKNHRQTVPLFHYVTSLAIFAATVGSFVNLTHSWNNHDNLYSASLICLITLILALYYIFIRRFPLKAQDRAIRAEENLSHYVLTGKLLDSRLRIGQIVALRFASDEEFPGLAQRAVTENLRADDIKKAIKNWKADFYRA